MVQVHPGPPSKSPVTKRLFSLLRFSGISLKSRFVNRLSTSRVADAIALRELKPPDHRAVPWKTHRISAWQIELPAKYRMKVGDERMPRFHTGLHTSDWHSYRDTPYKAKGWIVSFEEQATEFPRGGEYSGDRFYPYKEVIISARDQVIAQRAANTIYNVRNLCKVRISLECSPPALSLFRPSYSGRAWVLHASLAKHRRLTQVRIFRWPV